MTEIGVGAATLRGIWESVPSGKNPHLSSKRHLAIQGTHILVVEPHKAMGDGPSHLPAVEGAVEPRGGASLDRDLGISVMGITAAAIAMESDLVTAQRIVGSLFLHPLATHRCTHTGLGIF